MPRRDPETGQFVSGAQFNDYEVATFDARIGIEAANNGGGTGFTGEFTGFEGVELLDYDELVDRNEVLHLLEAHHVVAVYANSTETEDGTVRFLGEVSASPARQSVGNLASNVQDGDVVGGISTDDSIDILGRPLTAVGHAPFSDSASGVGGGGSAGEDRVEVVHPPGPVARFHPRDELFLNGVFNTWNIDDSGIHAEVVGQHTYGVATQ